MDHHLFSIIVIPLGPQNKNTGPCHSGGVLLFGSPYQRGQKPAKELRHALQVLIGAKAMFEPSVGFVSAV